MSKTYNLRANTLAVGWASAPAGNEYQMDSGTGASTADSVTMTASPMDLWAWTTAAAEPDSADWPAASAGDPYKAVIDVTTMNAAVALSNAGDAFGESFKRLNSALTRQEGALGTWDSTTGTGLKTLSNTSWNPAAGAAGDRFGVVINATTSNVMMDNVISITSLNTTTTYAQGPWSTGPASQNITPGLIQDGTVYSPTVAPGSVTATPGLIQDSTVYAPTAVQITNVVVGLIEDGAIYAPTAVPGSVNVVVGLIQDSTVYAPTAQPGAINITVGLIQESTVYEPTLAVGSVAVTPGLISDSTVYSFGLLVNQSVVLDLVQDSVVYTPSLTVGALTVVVGLIQDSTVLEPTLSVGSVTLVPGLISDSSVFQPSVVPNQSVIVGLVTDSAVYAPVAVAGSVAVVPGLITESDIYGLTLTSGGIVVTVGIIEESDLYAPTVANLSSSQTVDLGLVTQTDVYAPQVNLSVGIGLLGEAEVLSPGIVPGSIATTPGLISDTTIFDIGLYQITYIQPGLIGGTTPLTPAAIIQNQNAQPGLISEATLYSPGILPGSVQVVTGLLNESAIYSITLSQIVVTLGEVSVASQRLYGTSVSHTVIPSTAGYSVPDVVVSHRLTGES